MRRHLLVIACVCLIQAWLPTRAVAAPLADSIVRYVAPGAACGTASPCYGNLQAAVDAAAAGDEIRVAAGVYTGINDRGGSTQALYLDKSITLKGGYSLPHWMRDPSGNASVLDAEGQGRVLTVSGNIAPWIDGLRFTNGLAASGGGVYILGASVTLQNSEVYGNTAVNRGAGVYLENSRATITDSRIYSNVTGASGRGGGLVLVNSPAMLLNNVIENNRANVGGGVELQNLVQGSGARLEHNTIQGNTAFDYISGGNTFDGAGGGVEIGSYQKDTLRANTIAQNTAGRGGGLDSFNAPFALLENVVRDNHALIQGGGLYVHAGQPTIADNRVLSNAADGVGGGLFLWTGAPVLQRNLFQDNTAGVGGGLYGRSEGEFDGNRFVSNRAASQGGGAFLYRDDDTHYRNTVFMNNQAPSGAALYLSGTVASFEHTTLASNTGADGRGVMIDRYPGLANPSAPEQWPTVVAFTNTIAVSHAVAFHATAGNILAVHGVLWHDTALPIDAPYAYVTQSHEYTGDPGFRPDGYHLLSGSSSALDRGITTAIDHDVDGQLRPLGDGPDLGADEVMLTLSIGPVKGGKVKYVDLLGRGAMTVTVPAGAVPEVMDLVFTPFPPLPLQVTEQLTSGLTILGLPFRLDGLLNGLPITTTNLSTPLTVTLDTTPTVLYPMTDADLLAVWTLIGGLGNNPYLFGPGGIGHPQELGDSVIGQAIGEIGDPAPPVQPGTAQTAATDTDYQFLYYVFVGETGSSQVFLPLIFR